MLTQSPIKNNPTFIIHHPSIPTKCIFRRHQSKEMHPVLTSITVGKTSGKFDVYVELSDEEWGKCSMKERLFGRKVGVLTVIEG